jgi:hypothetical protein
MGELGWFEDKRVELIEGEILDKSGISPQRATAIMLVDQELRKIFTISCFVAVRYPINMGDDSEPEPELSLFRGEIRDYIDALPTTALMVVQVPGDGLMFDRTRRAYVYAQNGVPEYWIVNLKERQLEVQRNPEVQANGKYNYSEKFTVPAQGTVSPLAAPQATIEVADLLP